MPTRKSSDSTAEKKTRRPAAKKRAPRKRATRAGAAPAPAATASPAGDRLTEVARTIGSKVGGMVAKTRRALRRPPNAG